jgi:hypothetical protein
MIEGGNVYLCDKKEKRGKFYLELQDNREIKSNGEDLEQCKVDICSQIILWNGDGEAVLEFPPDKSKKMATGIEMYQALGYNEGVDILNTNSPFSGGYCKKCSHELGERTDELLNLEWKPKNVLVSIDYRTRKNENDSPRIFTQICIYHKKFIDLLTEDEKESFDTKPVLLKGKVSDYLELVPKKVIQACGHIGADYYHGILRSWKCSECKKEEFYVYTNEYGNNSRLVDSKRIREFKGIYFLKHSLHTSLVVRNDKWAELFKHKKEIKGIVTNPVIVLEEKYVEYPKLEEPEKFEW